MLGLGLGSQPTTESGIFGSYQSLNLDGNSDYVALPAEFLQAVTANNELTITAFSASAWVNLIQNDGDTSQIIFKIFTDTSNQFILVYHKYYTEWRGSVETGNDIRRTIYDIPGSSNDDGSGYDDGWQHFVLTYTIVEGAYSVKLYRNGSLVQNTTAASGQEEWEGDVTSAHIGANQDGSGSFVDGQIDQVAFWTIELDADAVTAIYNNGRPRDLTTFQTNYSPANLLAYYQFEGNALDSSGNSYHGTLHGTAGFSRNQP